VRGIRLHDELNAPEQEVEEHRSIGQQADATSLTQLTSYPIPPTNTFQPCPFE